MAKQLAAKLRDQILARDGYVCQYCGIDRAGASAVPRLTFQVDHIIPQTYGGVTAPHNLTTCCSRCNMSLKHTKTWVPRNLDAITADHPEWRARVLAESARPIPTPRTERLVLQLFPAEYEAVIATAAAEGYPSTADYIRAALGLPTEAARRTPPAQAEETHR